MHFFSLHQTISSLHANRHPSLSLFVISNAIHRWHACTHLCLLLGPYHRLDRDMVAYLGAAKRAGTPLPQGKTGRNRGRPESAIKGLSFSRGAGGGGVGGGGGGGWGGGVGGKGGGGGAGEGRRRALSEGAVGSASRRGASGRRKGLRASLYWSGKIPQLHDAHYGIEFIYSA